MTKYIDKYKKLHIDITMNDFYQMYESATKESGAAPLLEEFPEVAKTVRLFITELMSLMFFGVLATTKEEVKEKIDEKEKNDAD